MPCTHRRQASQPLTGRPAAADKHGRSAGESHQKALVDGQRPTAPWLCAQHAGGHLGPLEELLEQKKGGAVPQVVLRAPHALLKPLRQGRRRREQREC